MDNASKEYFSCMQIRTGFNFYRSGKVTSCCFSLDPALHIASLDDPALPQKILASQSMLIKAHKAGKAPRPCLNCVNFQKGAWPDHLEEKFTVISLNHYRACNLRCAHCGYRRNDGNESDTPHARVFEAIKMCINEGVCGDNLRLGVGGGEPSLAEGLQDILRYALDRGWTADINSNAAVFSPLFAEGVNSGQFDLWLTPDAGSRETYARIKGVDNFKNTWRNIGRYMLETQGRPFVKFIIEAGNRDDVPAMIVTSRMNGVKKLVVSLDMNIPKSMYEDYRKPVREFLRLALGNGFEVLSSGFVPREMIVS